jgi:hypothetical protein
MRGVAVFKDSYQGRASSPVAWLSPELEAYTPLLFPNPFPKASVEHELQRAG